MKGQYLKLLVLWKGSLAGIQFVFSPLVPNKMYCVAGCWVQFPSDAEYVSADLWQLLYSPAGIFSFWFYV